MVNFLISHGCVEKKTDKLKFPLDLSDGLKRHFIRGYFDGDGSIYTIKQPYGFYICGNIEQFLREISYEFEKIGITKQDLRQNKNNVFILQISRINDINRIRHYFYEGSYVYMERKKESFDKIKKMIGRL